MSKSLEKLRTKDIMKNSPFRAKGMPHIPLWIQVEAELGYWDHEMKLIYKKLPKSAIAKMIDNATGFSESLKEEALIAAKRITLLKQALEQETGEKADVDIEEKIIAALSKEPE